MIKSSEKNKEVFRQMDKEALRTFITAIIITAYFWLTIFLFKDDIDVTVFAIPLWFTLSCIGGYLLSVIAVIVLVSQFMKNFSLKEFDNENELD